MIDFNSSSVFKLKPTPEKTFFPVIQPFLLPDETIIQCFQTVRDGVIFTDKRIIAINTQGITGRKKDFSMLPYSKIQAFSIETAGTLDLDCELELWFSGLGKVKFEFTAQADVATICQIISKRVFI